MRTEPATPDQSPSRGAGPVIVIGAPRSGTSALAWAIAQHERFATAPEADFLYFLAKSGTINEVWEQAHARQDGFLAKNGVTRERFAEAMGSGINEVFRSVHGDKRWIDSSPANTIQSSAIAEMLPDAKFVHILRDGRAAIASMQQSGFDTGVAKDFECACRVWDLYTRSARALMERFPERVIEVRQEAMSHDPEPVMDRVFRFLGDEPCAASIEFLRRGRINSSYGNGSEHDLKSPKPESAMPKAPWSSWTNEQRAVFDEIAGATMIEMGYADENPPETPDKAQNSAQQRDGERTPVIQQIKRKLTRSNTGSGSGTVSFRCNICGSREQAAPDAFGRETASCAQCGSTSRMRAVAHLLTTELLGTDTPLSELGAHKSITGIGLSDWAGYAKHLERVFDYTNTYYDRAPQMDITDPPGDRIGSADFLISSDVFEHIVPPVSRAFEGAKRVLKPGGLLVFSVPYTLDEGTIEHYPELHDFRIEHNKVLINTTRDGREQRYDDLVFHGGEGATLEMRVFCKAALQRELEEAGFTDIAFFEGRHDPSGVLFQESWSRPLTARAPR